MRRNIILWSFCLSFVFVLAACSGSATAGPITIPSDTASPILLTDTPTTQFQATTAPAASPTLQATATLPSATPSLPPTLTPTRNTATPTPLPSATHTETPTIGPTRVSPLDQMVQVFVPSGEFLMGMTDINGKLTESGGRAYPEIPSNIVYLDSYWFDKYEVTNAQYALCVAAGGCEPPTWSASFTREHYYDDPQYANYPVIYVAWAKARAYCEWAGRRLPTEAEWEKAARGTDGREYPWGNEPISSERVNLCDSSCPRSFANPNFNDGYPETAPVGSFPAGASPYGAMDMAGNVWEWNGTLIAPYPYDATDGRENLDVTGERGWRGGAWSNGIWWMRASLRYRSYPWYSYYNLGFRCASSAQTSTP